MSKPSATDDDMKNIVLREITREDLGDINRWRSSRELVDCLGSIFRYVGPEVDSEWFNSYLASRSNNVRLAICVEGSARPVGVVYLLHIDWAVRSAELAIQIGEPRARGKGIGKYATKKMLEHAFLDLNLNRVYLRVLADNKTAIGLYRKLGFQDEGRERQGAFKGGRCKDVLCMSILAPEFTKGN